MPHYFFHTHDGVDHHDGEGLSCATLDEARAHAVRAAGDALRDRSWGPWVDDTWTMKVQDEYGITVCELAFSAK